MAEGKPRLCHLVKWPDFQGYGFNLHAERGKAGQFIGKVDEGSPAEAAGLMEGDRIVEINGTNIGNENHQQVVGRIKSLGDEVNLLVVDPDTDKYYKDIKQIVRGDLPEVVKLSAARDSVQEISSETEPTPEPHIPAEEDLSNEREPSEPEREPSPEPTPEPPREPSPEPEPERDSSPEPETGKENEEPEPTVISVNNVTNTESDSKYVPRLCHITKWPDFQGYGFNLHAERDRPGQFIGTIDDNSPAQAAGLQEGDRIIEVNGANIESESHKQVIERVKAGGNETSLLVVDTEADDYFKKNGITVSSSSPNVNRLANPPREGSTPSPASAPVNGTVEPPASQPFKPVQSNPKPVTNGNASNSNDPMMGMSAKEMREFLANKRKQDPKKKGNMDFAAKVNMLQKM